MCVRVTARGFDGETNARNEERWQKVVNLYKRLLITCLQFLHNFIMHNEHRKLVLWLDLFGNTQAATNEAQVLEDGAGDTTAMASEARIKETLDLVAEGRKNNAQNGTGYNIDDVHALFDLMNKDKEPDHHTQEAAKLLMEKIRTDMERLSGMNGNQLDDSPRCPVKGWSSAAGTAT